ncbi:MAG: CHC2 zinc finger domain-containing protein, partial [Pseudobacter sp.]|uniref:CHC2 zinc finger domain-containing protein n=1 Tax=Pseudobacter sp. TaxID=2045420 RepID=UPI003F7DCF66
MVDYLSSLGFQAQKTSGDQSWYHSPLHADKTPSFKVNRKLNKWYDFADGKGGNLIDFGIAFFNCSVKEFLSKLDLDHGTIRTIQHDPNQYNQHTGDAIQITRVQPIFSLPLQRYLRERRIPQHLADQYLKEVHYSLKGKNYYALGFRNDAGGYELRNQYIKGSTSPKSPTTYATDANTWCKTPTMGMPTSSLSV